MQHLTDEDIAVCAEALENDAYDSLSAEMRQHLSICDKCAEDVLAVSEVTADFRFEEPETPPLWSKSQKIIAWSVSVAAAAVFLLLIFESGSVMTGEGLHEGLVQAKDRKPANPLSDAGKIAATKTGEGGSDQQVLSLQAHGNQVADVDSDESQRTNEAFAGKQSLADESKLMAHYQPNEEMEKLIARSQGGLRNAEEINVQTPVNFHVNHAPFVLSWINKQNERLIIEIVDNTGERILKDETTADQLQVDGLSNGLYYWKLISEDFDLLFCGRVQVGGE